MKYWSYIAMSKDGFVATKDNGVEFLDNFQDIDFGNNSYDEFIKNIDTIIMGRATYQFIENFGSNPYEGMNVYVLSNTIEPKFGYKLVSGTPQEIDFILEKDECENIWVMGGPNVHQQFIDAGFLKEARVFVTSNLLGSGIPLFKGEVDKPEKTFLLEKECRFEIYKF